MGRNRSYRAGQRSAHARSSAPDTARFGRHYRPRLERLEDRVQPGDTILGLSAVALWGFDSASSDAPPALEQRAQDRAWHYGRLFGSYTVSSQPIVSFWDGSRTDGARSETNLTTIAPPMETAVELATPMSARDDLLTAQVAAPRPAGPAGPPGP